MMKRVPLGLAVAVVALLGSTSGSAAAQSADPAYAEPSSGLAPTIVGGVLLGVGAENLAMAPMCRVDSLVPERDVQDVCLYSSLIFGSAFVVVGVPLLVVGLGQRSKHRRWEEENSAAAEVLARLRVTVTGQTLALSLQGAF